MILKKMNSLGFCFCLAHAPNLETCTRKLCGGKFRPDTLPHVIRNVDFLTVKTKVFLHFKQSFHSSFI